MMKAPLVKILVSYHKPAVLLRDEVFTPLHLGRQTAQLPPEDSAWMKEHMPGDDTGDNISGLNDKFNEMTGVYWAWKNYDKLGNPDYIGFAHYRRHFIFDEQERKPAVEFEQPDKTYFQRLGLNKLPQFLAGTDLLSVKPCIWKENAYQQYKHSPHHKIEDLDLAVRILCKRFPDMQQAAKEYLADNKLYFFNMLILKKELFFDYCRYIFTILFEFTKSVDYKERSFEESRMYVSERLTAIYIHWLKKHKKYRDIPVSLLKDTEPVRYVRPKHARSVCVAFSLNNHYIPYFSACLRSLIANGSSDNFYDVFVLDEDISADYKRRLLGMCPPNVSLRFISIKPFLRAVDPSVFFTHMYYNISTYYRFFIPEIFKHFKKVLYIDADTILLDDAAKLYHTDIGGNYLGATRDLYIPLWLAMDNKMHRYLQEKLLMKNCGDYFQAGVMLLNIEQMRKNKVQEKLFQRLAQVRKPIIVDQDIFNSVCCGHVHFLDGQWNFDRNIEKFIRDNPAVYDTQYPAKLKNVYRAVKNNAKILHFAGPEKPWNDPSISFADLFWKYARQTPFYEEILFRHIWQACPADIVRHRELKPIVNYPKTLRRYYRCKILAAVTWGKKRAHYKQKRDGLHRQVREIRRFLKG